MIAAIPSGLRELAFSATAIDQAPRAIIVATLLLGVAGLATTLARRASASVRHTIWLVGLLATLGVVVISAAGPVIEVEADVVNAPGTVFSNEFVEAMRDLGPPTNTALDGGTATTTITETRAVPLRAANIALALWVLGLVVIAGRALAGHIGAARLIRRSRALGPAHHAMIASAARRAGVVSRVDVRISADVDGPFMLGARRPVVLLPVEAESWDNERMRIVLVHELAHVARLDYVAQLIATSACAIYWFNPIVWLAAARLRVEAEHAADDRVLAAGVDGVTYATHLLELARPEVDTRMATAMAVGMARSNRLERRFTAMLDSTRSRGTVPLRLQAIAGAAAMCVALPLTALRLVAAEAPATAPASPIVATTPATTAPMRVAPAYPTATTKAPRSATTKVDTIIERTIAAAAGERILVDLQTGGSITVHAWDQPQVRVRALLSGDQSRDTQVSFERAGRGVEFRARIDRNSGNWRNSNRIELWVPRRFDIHVSSSGGGVRISGVEGTFSGTTGGGEILLDNVRGTSSLTTGGGEIHVTDSQLDGYVTTGGGEALVSNTTGNVRVTSGSGPVIRTDGGSRVYGVGGNDINITTRGQTTTTTKSTYGSTSTNTVVNGRVIDGAFTMTKAGGSIELDAVPNGGTLNTGGGDIRIGSTGGSLAVTTGGGDIEIGQVAGDIAAATGAGAVRITLVNGDGSVRHVNVNSGTGRIVIDLPANLDARFDIETAYTQRHGRTNIESDFPLNVTETDEWDSRNGTPRRTVRGTGTSGAGRGVVRIRTVNGDVVIRRR